MDSLTKSLGGNDVPILTITASDGSLYYATGPCPS